MNPGYEFQTKLEKCAVMLELTTWKTGPAKLIGGAVPVESAILSLRGANRNVVVLTQTESLSISKDDVYVDDDNRAVFQALGWRPCPPPPRLLDK